MTRTSRAVGLALAGMALTAAPALRAQPGMPPNDPDSWKVAGTAKVLCSALFVSGRDSAEARSHVADYFLREKLDSITDLHIDRSRKLVRLTIASRVTREAKLYGSQGCVIHQPGRDTVFFTPVPVSSRLPDPATTPWPMGDLLPSEPPPAGLDTAKLRQATDTAFAHPAGLTAGFVVVHQGRIVAERYANGAHRDMQLESWSMGKSITGTLVGMLIQQGAFRLEDPAPVPEWRMTPGDPRAGIRVVDLLRMSSGLRFSRGSPEDLAGYHDHDLIYTGAIDAFRFAVTRELQFPPNTRGRYRNVDVMTLGLLIRDAVRARGEDYLTWPQRALFDKIGIRRQVLETDPYGNFLLSGYDYGTPRNWARLGMLYLNDGVWNGERLLPEGWTRLVSTPAPAWADSSYGGMVWVNGRGTWPLPRDAFAFRGAGGQETYVVPSLDLVVVRMGHFPGSRVGAQDLQRALRLIAEAVTPRGATAMPPVLDMHMHARTAAHYGATGLPLCAPVERMPRWDQRRPFGEYDVAPQLCRTPILSPTTDAEVLAQTLAEMQRHNVVGVLGGEPGLVAVWQAAAPGRFIPALDLRFDPATAIARAATPAGAPQRRLPVDSIRALHKRGAFSVLAEVMNQYAGLAPDDARLEPLWALAEQLDIPVGIHVGGGGPGEPYAGSPRFRARLQSALTLEEVLVKHPKLRLYVMHGGYPLLEDLLALLFTYPQVYVELSMAANVETRPAFYRYLRGIVEAGYGDRVMFGSDQMVWPGLIGAAVRSIQEAQFLTAEQKRDIFYHNAARFLRLTEAEITRHHGK